jgi:putative ABC transport system permease protein
MMNLALKMLIGNKAACLGVIFGIFMATLLICQQSAIFLGLVSRSYRLVTDIPQPNLWVIDPSTESDEKARGMPLGYLDVIRGIPNIEWAAPINVNHIPMSTQSGIFHIALLYGIDAATLIGAPTEIVEGNLHDLYREGGVVIDTYSANDLMATRLPDGTKAPLKIGDTFEINNHRAVIVAICKITQGFYPMPIVFTSNKSFNTFSGFQKDNVEFIAAKTRAGANIDEVLKAINSYPMFKGLTSEGLKWRMAKSFLQTGILINFGLSLILGIIVGFSIAGQIFYIITLHNMKYYALIKSIGGNEKQITRMILYQTLVVGIIGFLLGTGATLLWGMAIKDTTLAFMFPWELLLFTAFLTVIICLFTAGLSIRKIANIDPKLLIGN